MAEGSRAELLKAVQEIVVNVAEPVINNLLRREHQEQVAMRKHMEEIQGKVTRGEAELVAKAEKAATRIEKAVKAAEDLQVDEIGVKVRKLADRLQLAILRETVATEMLWFCRKSGVEANAILTILSNLYEVAMWEDAWWMAHKNLLVADWMKLLTVNFDLELSAYQSGWVAGGFIMAEAEYAGLGASQSEDEDDEDDADEVGEIVQAVVNPPKKRVRSRPSARTPFLQADPKPKVKPKKGK